MTAFDQKLSLTFFSVNICSAAGVDDQKILTFIHLIEPNWTAKKLQISTNASVPRLQMALLDSL
jgi:hypothetical protein